MYALLPDETCWFLAADFDKKTWEYDSQAFLETCSALNVPATSFTRCSSTALVTPAVCQGALADQRVTAVKIQIPSWQAHKPVA